MAKVPIDSQDAPQAARRPIVAITAVEAQGDGRVAVQLVFDPEAVSAIFRALDLGGGPKAAAKPRRAKRPKGEPAEPRVKRPRRAKSKSLTAWAAAALASVING